MRKYLLSIFCAAFLLPGCSNYLDMVPEKDIETVESVFEQKTKVLDWWKGLYADMASVFMTTSNLSYMGADEFVTCTYLYKSTNFDLGALKVANGLQMSQSPYGSIWYSMYKNIRNCNTFLSNIDRTYNITEKDREWWRADVKALKAFIYFELVRRYGPINLVPENMPVDMEIEKYQLPRLHVDTCFKEIINLLDEAMKKVPMRYQRQSGFGHTFCLEALHALKARVLLYAASPLFNGNPAYSDFKNKNGELLFSSTYDKNKWLLAAEAADEAARVCALGDRALSSGSVEKSSELLNKMYDIEMSAYSAFSNKEYLLEWKHNQLFATFTLPRLLGDDEHYNSSAIGCLSPSMKMVEMYYTKNGLPLNVDPDWTSGYANRHKLGSESNLDYQGVIPLNTTVLNLHMSREPRFYAHIAGDRMYWQRGNGEDYNLLVEAHKGEKPWGTQEDFLVSNTYQNINGYWLKKHIYSWVATNAYQNLLQGNETMAVIRLAEVYMIQAEAWNEYLDKPDARVWDPLDKVRERAGIPKVRDAWAKTSFATRPETKVGMREIIQQEWNIEFAFEGQRYWNLRRWLTAHKVMNEKQMGWNVLGTTFETFYNNENGPIELWVRNKFVAPRDYLEPFRAEEILTSGMVQNPEW